MDFLHVITLALVQGLTEFLPISSSAHLILLPNVVHWQDQGLAFDIAVHVGTLAAVIFSMRHELRPMLGDWLKNCAGAPATADSNLAWDVLWASIPVALGGLFFSGFIETSLRSPLVIAGTTIIFGLLLWWADVRGRHTRDEHSLGWREAVLIGVSQALALVPGVSRSGITMTTALLMNLDRRAAARFSFLLSIPAIIMAGGFKTLQLMQQAAPVDWTALVLGAVVSAISAWLCIVFFMKLLERISFLPFVIYRLVLGAVLVVMFI